MSNVAIRVNGVFLELTAKFVFSQVKRSPLYFGQQTNFIPGNYTLPSTIETSAVNRGALRHRDFIDNTETFSQELPADVYLLGNFYERGRLIVKLANPRQYRIQFMSGTGELAALKEKSIREYDLGAIDENGTDPEDLTSKVYQTWNDSINNPQDYPFLYYRYYYPHPLDALPDYKGRMHTVNMYVKDVLKGVSEGEGFNFEGDIFDFYYQSRYILFFSRGIPQRRFVNTDGSTNYHLELNTCVPNITVSTLVSNLAKTFCWCFYVDSNRRTMKVFEQKDVLKHRGIDRSSRVAGTFERSETNLRVKRLEYEFTNSESENHEAAKTFAAYNYVGAVVNTSDLPTEGIYQGDIMYVHQLMSYVAYFEDFVSQSGGRWDTYNAFQDLHGLDVDLTGAKIESKCGTVYVHADDERDGYDYQTDVAPLYRGEIYYNENAEQAEDFAVCCYYGKYQFREINQRALVSYYPYATDGQNFGSHSLRWRGDDGIYNRSWKTWLDFINTSDAVTVDMLWTENDLSDSDIFLKPMFLYDEHSGTKQRFLMKEMKIVVGMQDGLRVANQKLVQMRDIQKGK